MSFKKQLFSLNPSLVFWLGAILLCVPIFSMDYILSLDGPTHMYNANLFNQLVFEDNEFIGKYISFNSEFTPNYIGLIWSALLLKVFSPIIATKVFFLSYILGLLFSFKYFVSCLTNQIQSKWSFSILFTFIYSFFVISGFINFYLAFIPMLLTAGYYIKQTELNVKNITLICLGILLTYFSHSIVFGFLIILLGSYEFTNSILIAKDFKKLLISASKLILFSIIPIILTLLFLGQRNSEASYLEFGALVDNLFQMSSIKMFNSQGVVLGYIFSLILLVLSSIIIVRTRKDKQIIKPKDSLLVAAAIFLACYFVLPDSVGFASVFSVRIEYMFWVCVALWVVVSLKTAYLSYIITLVSFVILIWNVSIVKSELSNLNSIGKKVVAASEFIEPNSVVYPVFASSVWNHFHFSNLLGLEKPIIILENGAARQDYFPIQYNQPYEDCFTSEPSRVFGCSSQTVKIDYIIVLGSEWVAVDADQAILSSLTKKDSLIYENPFVKLYKLD